MLSNESQPAEDVVLPTMAEGPAASDRIKLRFLVGDSVPLHLTVASEQDVYTLLAPLRRTEALFECDGRVFFDGVLSPGMLSMTSPGEHTRKVFRTPMRAAVIQYPGHLLRRKIGRVQSMQSTPQSFSPLLQPNSQVQRIVSALPLADKFGPGHRQLFLDGLAYALLACFARQRVEAPPRHTGATKGLSDDEFTRCVEFADARISARVDLHEWAAVIGMSVAEFAKLFQSRTGEPPYAWFMNWRIDRSKEMLRAPGVPLTDIALGVGFCSQSHFTEAFRRRVGVSPGRWRSQLMSS